ncbi:MAG: aromatic acid exporter family protein [Gudongella sp.]|nr:aromatic acid exporter family protein [Gudongella sp.]
MLNIKKYIGMRTLKTALGAGVGIFLAQLLNLNYGVNTAIVVILSLQNTKRKSLNLAGVRILSTIIALAISRIVFSMFGFGPLSFSIYLIIFIPIVVKFKLNEGLVPSSVLVSHLLASQSVIWGSLVNEFAQMLIGASIALVLNLYIPGLEEHLINDLAAIKKLKYRILENMKISLLNETDPKEYMTMLNEMEQRIKFANERVLNETGENFNRGLDYHLKYLKMESDHLETIRYMNRSVEILKNGFSESIAVSKLIGNAISQLKSTKMDPYKIEEIRTYLDKITKQYSLETMDGFQVKSAVFQYVEDLIKLLETRNEFLNSLSFSDRKFFREMHSKIQEVE